MRLDGKVALVTGAAQGQGRAYARGLAAEGADVILVDVCRDDPVVNYSLGTSDDLAATAELVRQQGRRALGYAVDVRDEDRLRCAVDDAVQQFTRLDIVVANAGICTSQRWDRTTTEVWDSTIATNLTGAWHTCRWSAPHLIRSGGGSIILVSSAAGLRGLPLLLPYVVSKHGLVGLMRALANELGPHDIRVNTVHPGAVDTAMGAGVHAQMAPALLDDPSLASFFGAALPRPQAQPDDLVPTIVYLASDDSRFVTGSTLPVDAGTANR